MSLSSEQSSIHYNGQQSNSQISNPVKQKCKEMLMKIMQQKKQKNKQQQTFHMRQNQKSKQPINFLQSQQLIKFRSFVNKLGKLRNSQIRSDVLTKYSRLLPNKINSRINVETVETYIRGRAQKLIHLKQKSKKWDLHDFLSLFWVASKILDLKQTQNSNSEPLFNEEDYTEMDQIFKNANPKCCQILNILKQKKYTDRWTQSESIMLRQIGRKYEDFNKDKLNFFEISKELSLINKEPLALYRCPIQCQRQWKKLRKDNRQWTTVQDDLLLKIAQIENKQIINWKEHLNKFSNRSQVALRTRFFVLMQKLTAICPFSSKINKKELIKLKLDGDINIDKQLSQSQIRQLYKKIKQSHGNKKLTSEQILLNKIEPKSNQIQNGSVLNYKQSYQRKNIGHNQNWNKNFRPNGSSQSLGQLIMNLQTYTDKIMQIINQLKLIDEEGYGRVVYEDPNAQMEKERWETRKKNQRYGVKNKRNNRLIYKSPDFEVIKQIHDESQGQESEQSQLF